MNNIYSSKKNYWCNELPTPIISFCLTIGGAVHFPCVLFQLCNKKLQI